MNWNKGSLSVRGHLMKTLKIFLSVFLQKLMFDNVKCLAGYRDVMYWILASLSFRLRTQEFPKIQFFLSCSVNEAPGVLLEGLINDDPDPPRTSPVVGLKAFFEAVLFNFYVVKQAILLWKFVPPIFLTLCSFLA